MPSPENPRILENASGYGRFVVSWKKGPTTFTRDVPVFEIDNSLSTQEINRRIYNYMTENWSELPLIAYRYGRKGMCVAQIRPEARKIQITNRYIIMKGLVNKTVPVGTESQITGAKRFRPLFVNHSNAQYFKGVFGDKSPLEITGEWDGQPFSAAVQFIKSS